MTPACFRFEDFLLDVADRRLLRGSDTVELNGRYLDALTLLVREQGRLVTKDRFLDEVWRGVPVTDEALTQCIRTLRRQLGDDAAAPRFIETVPKHGYRFIAAVKPVEGAQPQPSPNRAPSSRSFVLTAVAGTLGSGIAGVLGGLCYGLISTSQPQADVGSVSLLLVLVSLTGLLALVGGAGVSLGIASAARITGGINAWSVLGGAAGGFVVGTVVKLLGHDALLLLLGIPPVDFAGAMEGAMLGAAAGLATVLAVQRPQRSFRLGVNYAALIGAAAGVLVTLMGGHLLGGSLNLLVHQVHSSRLSLDGIGSLVGERSFGPVSEAVTAGLEAMAFVSCVAGGIILARRRSHQLPTETI